MYNERKKMDNIVFLGKLGVTYKATLNIVSEHVIKLTFDDNMPTMGVLITGFYVANEHNFSNMSGTTYYGYKTVYKNESPIFYLSNDGSEYVPPEPPTPEPKTLDEVKAEKINQFKTMCYAVIVAGVDVEIDGEQKHFSYDSEDQTNIKEIFDLALATKIDQFYHADGETCALYSVESIIKIYAAESMNKLGNITYYNQMRIYIGTLETIDEVEAITYGDELPEPYIDIYNSAMAQAEEGIKALIGG